MDMPTISVTFIPPNHYRTVEEDDIIQAKLDKEVALGRMSGPFTIQEAERFYGGPFRTAPLAIVPKPGDGPDQWRMVQNLSFRDEFGMSVNDFIDSDDFPTTWGTAQIMADWVGLPNPLFLLIPFLHAMQTMLALALVRHPLGVSLWCARRCFCTLSFRCLPLACPTLHFARCL